MTPLILVAGLALAPSSPQEQVKSRYQQWDAAYYSHDVLRLAAMLHPRFVLISGSGKKVGRKEYVARLWKSALPEAYTTDVLRIKVDGNQATAWTLERSKEAGSALAEHRYEDRWELSNGRWLLLQSKTLGER
jgi:ketosteroid isomerase-like protein